LLRTLPLFDALPLFYPKHTCGCFTPNITA